MKQTAVEWLEIQLFKKQGKFNKSDIEQAKAIEKEQSHEYAEFAIRCDRNYMKILNFEDWTKITFKSE